MRRLIRFLLVCFLAAAMGLKGMAAMAMPLAVALLPGAHVAQVAQVAQAAAVPPGHSAARLPHAARGDAPARHAHRAGPACAAHTAHTAHAGHTAHGQDVSHADAALGPAPADATPRPITHKGSACEACAAAAALPVQALRLVAPGAGTTCYPGLSQGALRFLTDGPDRPPRSSSA